jgi:hypothetical protein
MNGGLCFTIGFAEDLPYAAHVIKLWLKPPEGFVILKNGTCQVWVSCIRRSSQLGSDRAKTAINA